MTLETEVKMRRETDSHFLKGVARNLSQREVTCEKTEEANKKKRENLAPGGVKKNRPTLWEKQ